MCPSASHQVASRRACLLKICLQNLERLARTRFLDFQRQQRRTAGLTTVDVVKSWHKSGSKARPPVKTAASRVARRLLRKPRLCLDHVDTVIQGVCMVCAAEDCFACVYACVGWSRGLVAFAESFRNHTGFAPASEVVEDSFSENSTVSNRD